MKYHEVYALDTGVYRSIHGYTYGHILHGTSNIGSPTICELP